MAMVTCSDAVADAEHLPVLMWRGHGRLSSVDSCSEPMYMGTSMGPGRTWLCTPPAGRRAQGAGGVAEHRFVDRVGDVESSVGHCE